MSDSPALSSHTRDPALDVAPDLLRTLHERMLLTRALDLRSWALSRQGKAHFIVTGRGHEAAQVGSAMALQVGIDVVFPYYRDLGVGVGLGMTAREVMLGVFARAADPSSAGRQLPMHLSRRDLNLVSGSSVTATQIPHAVGAALAIKYRREEAVAVTYFGEASTSKGDFHEGVNFAAVHHLPVLFFCENNGYGISVPQRLEMVVERVADRASAYGIPGITIDGRDPVRVLDATRAALERIRAGNGPELLEAICDRLTPHTSDDNDKLYRTTEELEEAQARDPVPAFGSRLVALGILDDDAERDLRQAAADAVDDAVAYAEASRAPRLSDLLKDVLAPPEE